MKTKKKPLPVWKTSKPLCITPKDKRYKKFKTQLKENGFSDVETWNLHYVIASFSLPRLKRFKKITICHPYGMTHEKWLETLDEMIFAFEFICEDPVDGTPKDWKRVEKGLNLFSKHFLSLWW